MAQFTTTENGAVGHATSGSKCLDFFSLPTRGYDNENLLSLFDAAFAEDPRTTLQVLYHLRDPRNGKGEKELTLVLLEHMLEHYPNNYKSNLSNIVSQYGCYKMLCELYARDYEKRKKSANLAPLSLLASRLSEEDPLAAKWAPSEHGQFNHKKNGYQATKLCQILNLTRTNKEENQRPDYGAYRKLLTPLRTKANIVEQLCCSNRWDDIEFSKVAAKAMSILSKKAFPGHCSDKFGEWKAAVAKGKAEVKTQGLQPHEIVRSVRSDRSGETDVLELQWKQMVQKVKAAGNLKNAIALSDVSGSMYYGGPPEPINVSIALGVFISEVCGTGKIMTFSNEPKVVDVRGTTLKEKINSVAHDCMGYNTDFVEALRSLLSYAQLFSLSPEDIPKYIFVLSDMEFDEADVTNRERNPHDVVKADYIAAGYSLPKIIYWNLACRSNALPVSMKDENTALVSGFSQMILKAFMELDPKDAFDPLTIMRKILEPYTPNVCEECKPKIDVSTINNQVSAWDTTQPDSTLDIELPVR